MEAGAVPLGLSARECPFAAGERRREAELGKLHEELDLFDSPSELFHADAGRPKTGAYAPETQAEDEVEHGVTLAVSDQDAGRASTADLSRNHRRLWMLAGAVSLLGSAIVALAARILTAVGRGAHHEFINWPSAE